MTAGMFLFEQSKAMFLLTAHNFFVSDFHFTLIFAKVGIVSYIFSGFYIFATLFPTFRDSVQLHDLLR